MVLLRSFSSLSPRPLPAHSHTKRSVSSSPNWEPWGPDMRPREGNFYLRARYQESDATSAPSSLAYMGRCPGLRSREGDQHQQLVQVSEVQKHTGGAGCTLLRQVLQPSAYCAYVFWVHGVWCSLVHGELEDQKPLN